MFTSFDAPPGVATASGISVVLNNMSLFEYCTPVMVGVTLIAALWAIIFSASGALN
jgi:hypothetical protein